MTSGVYDLLISTLRYNRLGFLILIEPSVSGLVLFMVIDYASCLSDMTNISVDLKNSIFSCKNYAS